MKASSVASLLAICGAAVAAPAAAGPSVVAPAAAGPTPKEIEFNRTFTILVHGTGNPDLNSKPLNANNGAFWVGKPTNSKCPKGRTDCPAGDTTVFLPMVEHNLALSSFERFDKQGKDFVFIDGQRLYLAPDGSVGFVTRDNKGAPKGSTFDGWIFSFGTIAHTKRGANPDQAYPPTLIPYACSEQGAYRLFYLADKPPKSKGCTQVSLQPQFIYGAGDYV